MADSRPTLDGKVAIVTGGAGGIGAVTGRLLAEAGAQVVLADLPGTDVAAKAKEAGSPDRAVACEVDISSEGSVKALIDFTVQTFGGLDIVHNNAALTGLPGDLDVVSMTTEVWDAVFDVNARGAMLMCKHSIPAMIESGGGSIINMSSGMAEAADLMATAYACSKGAINTLTFYVATQYGDRGIRCNTISPGVVHTPAVDRTMPEPVRELIIEHKAVGRLGEPRDIAELVSFLGSDASSFITGANLHIDGGFRAHVPSLVDVRRMLAGQSTTRQD
ncbi:SDR family NAD(P)-dependent oxidoreductase [Streptomyces ipomoeae]|uniref:SDR family NAD(P)-dependent oxidoreductase n=1 Tax=Streptomyces ipomoeae TaxID=103232 RepID=UPI0011478583|nr:SDR family oxidoreductase [Streptomyces ipomoeae]MDX2937766.1 SDR family oxidoreductase [Streptomyces ipomoeae]TQE17227.1 SDR family oxidoreductase [Streptomyces ipomoeae]